MDVIKISGANYGEYWPTKGYDSTNLPPGLPVDFLMFTRVSQDGRIVGKAHSTGEAIYWTGSKWISLGPTQDNSPVAFHPHGNVYVDTGVSVEVFDLTGVRTGSIQLVTGSNGIRNVLQDGTIITGDASYGDGTVNEFTDLPCGRIGQGHASGGIVAVIGGAQRMIQEGSIYFIRANQVGNQVAIYGTDLINGYKVLTTVEELAAMPVYVPPSPTVVIHSDPIPPKEPVMDFVTSQLSDALLMNLINGALQAANSSDDPKYWFDAIRAHPTPAGQNDWLYWAGRIATGDGVGKGYKGSGTVLVPVQPPALIPDYSSQIAALQAQVAALEAKVASIPPQPDMSEFVKKGDTISGTATGHVTLYGLKSSDATWVVTGKVD